MKKAIFAATALCFTVLSQAQITSSKDGDIKLGDKTLAEIEKYDGNAETRPKFRVLNEAKDTLVKINFKKDFAYDWMQFYFPKQNKTIEVNTSEIVKGLNYRKNIGSFLASSNLIAENGGINEAAFASLSEKYNENLTEKYFKLNEMNRIIASTKFDYQLNDNKLFINGKHVGFATIPEGQAEVRGIMLYDINNQLIGQGDVGMFKDVFKMKDGKELTLGFKGANTVGGANKLGFAVSMLRELFRNGYYKI